ncbi:MAG: SH3 domain-containing protein [Thermomicrobiales bacterium]|nr:SH3 domain-containing protein [Thermomicrobiales bacterium]
MPASISRVPRCAIAVVVSALILSLIVLSGPGRANAQDSTPTPDTTQTATPSEEVTAADEDTVEAADADFAVGDTPLVADGPLNVRDGAGIDADVLFQLETGATVEITDGPEAADDYTWYEIETEDGETGWVAGEFLGDEVVSPGFAAGDAVVVVDGPLNVREDSSLDSDVLLQLETGEGGTVLSGPVSADDYTWYEIEIDDETSGWAAGEFLGAPDDVPAGSDGDFAIGDGITVAVDGMNFRADAGLDAEVLDTLDLDALFLVQDGPVSVDGYTWYLVFNYYYGEGWVAGELMTLDPDGFPVEEGA